MRATSSDQAAPPPTLTVGGYGTIDPLTGRLLVPIAAPPNKVIVTSNGGGLNERQVSSLYFTGAVNNAPVASADAFTIFEDCSPTAALSCATPQVFNVLANDTIAGGPLPAGGVVTIVTPPSLGAALVNLDGTIGYTPNANANGADSFSYTVTVNGFASNTAVAAITIAPINDTPVAANDNFAVGINTATPVALGLDVFANDTDPDGKGDLGTAINIVQTGGPVAGVFTGGAAGVVTFTTTVPGTYTFTYQVQDKGGRQVPTLLLTSNVATATVVATGAVLTITKAQYTISQSRLVVSGTVTPAGGQTVTVFYADAAGAVIGTAGTAVVAATGTWLLDLRPVTLPAGTARVIASILDVNGVPIASATAPLVQR